MKKIVSALTLLFVIFMPAFSQSEPFDEIYFIDSYSGIIFKKLNNNIYLGVYEVTQGQWERVMDTIPFTFDLGEDYPTETVSLSDIQQFLNNLNINSQSFYRLPTVKEWMQAVDENDLKDPCIYANLYDISSNNKYNIGNGYFECDDSFSDTSPVGSFAPNKKGFYDLFGNVKEWLCNSEFDKTNTCANLLRAASLATAGGSFVDSPRDMKKYINDERTSLKSSTLGFRLAISANMINPDSIIIPDDDTLEELGLNTTTINTIENIQSTDDSQENIPKRKFKFLPFLWKN